jgi:phage repressor protein C with HTH and peptisase S24 domain
MKNFSTKLLDLMQSHKISAAALSRKSGISEAQISRWLKENGKPSFNSKRLLSSAFGVPITFFDESPSLRIEEPVEKSTYGEMPGWYHFVVAYKVVTIKNNLLDFSEGASEVFSYSVRRLEVLNAQAHNLFAMYMSGDSMCPEIRHGDRLLIDRSKTEFTSGAPLLLSVGNQLLVRNGIRVKNRVTLEAINKNYESQQIALADVTVVGRVLEITRDMQ